MNNTKIETGHDVCPKCKYEDWKSAKMVVMEGTTKTTGTIIGEAKDPGKLSGGINNFLLSDRWFSWEYPLEGDISLTTSTGLVQQVKQLMVDNSADLKIPGKPQIHIQSTETTVPQLPIAHWIISKRNLFRLPISPQKPIERIANYIVSGGLLLLVAKLVSIGLEGQSNHDIALFFFFMFAVPIIVFMIYIHEVNQIYTTELNKLIKSKKIQTMSTYEKQLDEYESKVDAVMVAREQLWARARVCTRCGTAYLGPD